MDNDNFIIRSSESKEDAHIENNQKNRHTFALKVCYIVLFLEMLCLFLTKEQNYGIYTLFFTFSSADGFEEYRVKKNKFYLVASIVCLITAVFALYKFILELVGA